MSAAISIAKAALRHRPGFRHLARWQGSSSCTPADPLFPGEKVVTARDAQAVVKLADGREISLDRSESLQLDGDVCRQQQPGRQRSGSEQPPGPAS